MELDLTLVLSSSRIGKSVRGDEWAEDSEYELEAAIDGGWKVLDKNVSICKRESLRKKKVKLLRILLKVKSIGRV